MTYGEMPSNSEFPITDKARNLILYTSLPIYGSNFMFSDVLPEMPLHVGNNINITIGIKDIDEITSIFNKIKEGGNVIMELQETFFSKWYGMVVDKFGIPWQFSYDPS